jgi:hypothetical protein
MIQGDWFWIGLWCLTTLSTIFQVYRGGQFYWWWKAVSGEKTPTCRNFEFEFGKLYHLQLSRVHPFCNLQSRARTNAVLVIGLYEL